MSVINHMMMAINRNQANIGYMQLGTVTSVNAANSTIKVILRPTDAETGFIPYSTPWIGWYAPPVSGDQVVVLFQQGSKNVPFGAFLLYSKAELPPTDVAEGEAIWFHTSGSFIKLTNDGKVLLNGNAEIDLTAPTINIVVTGGVNITAPSDVTITGNLTVTGTINATGDITDLNGANGSVQDMRQDYNAHTHNGVTSGPDDTGPADPQMG